ncbi:hypothetical protein P879_11375 [Paragonimus westermani]|uniref:Serine/threonine-protein phosphatase PGAM5, mitochondrial n=1 Tax=Paragonimus westermani TaxID=34504 RepID=A0A8T0D9A8_9TREM|nr:hypothetical protein P879_11375 [Paragonimus westermani]
MNVRRGLRILAGGILASAAVLESHSNLISSPFSNSINQSNHRQYHSFSQWIKSLLRQLGPQTHVFADTATPSMPKTTPWDWNWDGRGEPTSHTSGASDSSDGHIRRPTCSRHLIFIRHGQYHYADSDVDCHLTPLGRQQLSLTGIRLKELNFPYSIIHYSTMTRAVESTEEVLKHLPDVKAVPSDLLCEGAPYPLEPPLPFYCPTEKDFKEDGQRIESAFKSFVHRPDKSQTRDSYEIFICHANVIRYIVCRSLQLPPEAWIRFTLDHGSITWLVIRSDGRVALRCLGNSGHMPLDKISVQ